MVSESASISGNTRSRKRARAGSNSTSSPDALDIGGEEGGGGPKERDEKFWYEDGTIILIARNVEFRVYKGILADLSPVFRDMFSLPQPPDSASATSAACPVVHLTDSPQDLRHILRVCMGRREPNTYDAHEPTYDAISACIRLGHKYQISPLVEDSIKYLKKHFTDDLDVWSSSTLLPHFTLEHSVGVINLARLLGEHSLLPIAFLDCAEAGASIINGVAREDGSKEQLPLDDIGRCLSARYELATCGLTVATRVFRPANVSVKCKNAKDCRVAFRRTLALFDKYANQVVSPDPCAPFTAMFAHESDVKLCAECQKVVTERDKKERQDVWNRLPATFGIEVPGWGTNNAADA